jgi:ABC-type Zn uptake system ZnuABC Zn-binding protein ZnuA
MRLGRIGWLATIMAAVPLVAIGCGTATESARPGSGAAVVEVVTTTTVFADIVANVGGERVSATSIIPAGVGPEDYEPKPDDAKLLAGADLIVSNGVGLDDFLDTLFASGSGETAARLVLGDGLPTIDEDGRPNPHFWLDPTLVKGYYLPAIVKSLSGIDPPGTASYEENAAAYGAKLDDLDRELQAEVDRLPPQNRRLVTFHDAFPYFASHFGFELVGVVVDSVGQEPSAAELAALIEKVRAAHVKAVFSEAQFNPRLTDTLAQEAGITNIVTTLYNDALGPPPADSYTGLMRWNVEQIVTALR